jgi:Zn-dependent peptidase ImmA (M78 family)
MNPGLVPNRIRASAAAQELLQQFAITASRTVDVFDLATAKGAVVIEAPLEGCEARLIRSRTRGVIRVRKDIPEAGRKRFAVAHELGHYLLHAEISQYFICTAEDLRDYRRSPVEIEANCFAAYLLMPPLLFRPQCRKRDPNLETVRLLAKEFNTSLPATAIRFVEECGQTCVAVMSRDGRVEWARGTEGYRGPRISPGQQLSPYSLAYHCKPDTALSAWQEVPASAWLEEPADIARWEVMEQSLGFRGYPFVLTLLCLTEKEEEAEDTTDRFSRRHLRGDEEM